MSESNRCNNCGGSDGNHFNDCNYDGTSGGSSSSNNSIFKWVLIVFGILLLGALIGASPEVLAVILALPILYLYVGLFLWIFE